MSLTGKPSLTTAADIVNDGFWTDVSMADLMSKYRIPSEYDNDVISWGLSLAVVRVNELLDRIKRAVLAMPFTTFTLYLDSNSVPVVGSELLLVHYQHAVFSRAKANLLQQFSTMNRRDQAENDDKESETVEQYWLDESANSIATLMKVFFPDEQHISNDGVVVELL